MCFRLILKVTWNEWAVGQNAQNFAWNRDVECVLTLFTYTCLQAKNMNWIYFRHLLIEIKSLNCRHCLKTVFLFLLHLIFSWDFDVIYVIPVWQNSHTVILFRFMCDEKQYFNYYYWCFLILATSFLFIYLSNFLLMAIDIFTEK